MILMNNMSVAEYLIKKLEEEGVKYVFGLPGEQVLHIYEALRKSKIKHILVKHEQAAVHAADAYARITGEYGVCIATAGPGAMNMVMGVSTAYKDNVPLIVITGDVAKKDKGSDCFQDIDINGVFKPITLKSFYSNSPEKLMTNIEEVFNNKKCGINGPFHINIAKDVQNKILDVDHRIITKKKINTPLQLSILDTIKCIDESEKPLIIAGSGIIYADAINEFYEFVEKTQIPVTTTFTARGIISEEEDMNLGMTGIRSTKQAKYATEHADLIIALGTRLCDRTTTHITCDNIIQVNTNQEHKKVEQFYHNDVKKFLQLLNDKQIKQSNPKWHKRILSQGEYPKNKLTKTELLNQEEVVRTILSKQDENITFIYDAGQTPTYFTIDSKPQRHSQLLFPGGFGPMGYSIPASIGASFARENDVIITCPGDGSAQMTIEELAVINTYKLPIIIVIIDNQLLGIIKQWQDMAEYPNYQVKLENPDFVRLAHAYNIDAEEVTTIQQLSDKLDMAIKNKKPYLIHLNVADQHIPLPNRN